ncbi:Holliday junction branch migration protein RuvA [Pediococcus claussenii]|uniref:Holliday junction branch migration complex subunit RuvA n=1 Tax=Pediococcus claussenii (strain ATCC BAA-344 / DSM 14800 / JCM 18046 / KCTC 3811 / LMG 21948 / P06) TaxID=701521 RepID=G8PCM0_PEDCP|nr:Holliday junction branch migration protein RuvA [Pediococcus claussenii]AEV95005.1 holliday junction DNA helicase RuvA [Pediococcus claussenii ATCC BAA-344]ANZ70194.1 Holliday junction ATP-dependent DNA helicase RuvA [Pediococcus claussenii]ANZ72010.1 Holliday junction ATP-dependent DNA helicase RuvA [Pediococcus claussenii]KRN19193.1 ruvA protein [Pediococcus claussenii]
MYDFLEGTVEEVFPAYVVLNVAGVGYLIYVANPYKFQVNSEQRIFVYQSVSESDISLFGFSKRDDKELFLNLIKVKGIGPKSALAILANEDHTGLISAINNDDVNYLKKFPKIGPKAAQQIILDLKGKIATSNADIELSLSGINMELDDAAEALLALGYSNKDVKNTIKKLDSDTKLSTTDQYISAGLKLLMNS